MKVLAENLKDIVQPLESITINLSPDELDYLRVCTGEACSADDIGYNLFDKLDALCKKYKIKIYSTKNNDGFTIVKN
jgi:hypothetical protein